jgi:hypothetical protein
MSLDDVSDTIVPKSDQLNSEQLISGPMTFTITNVSRGSGAEQPISLFYSADPSRPFKPCKTMRKLLVDLWGKNAAKWIGKSMTVYRDAEVLWAGEAVGGIRISHMSDIASDKVERRLQANKKSKKLYTVLRLVDITTEHRTRLESSIVNGLESFKSAWEATPAPIRKQLGEAYKNDLKAKAEKVSVPVAEPEKEEF